VLKLVHRFFIFLFQVYNVVHPFYLSAFVVYADGCSKTVACISFVFLHFASVFDIQCSVFDILISP